LVLDSRCPSVQMPRACSPSVAAIGFFAMARRVRVSIRIAGAVAAAATAASAGAAAVDQVVPQCPGSVDVSGVQAAVVATQKNLEWEPAEPVTVTAGVVEPQIRGRAYLAESCSAGQYNHTQYLGWQLLGKKLSYTTDVSQAGCGCNAAMYLVSMKQNAEVSGCDDFYCDANEVCGVRCDEIDIQEANRFAWHTALHRWDDGNGLAAGLGGWVRDNHFEMTPGQYGPGGSCIDTLQSFRVEASFPADGGRLRALEMRLTQPGKSSEVSYSLDSYPGDPGFEHLSQSLAAGMTPVFSYWKADDMLWLDGPGAGGGPCQKDGGDCGTAPSFSDFKLEDIGEFIVFP